MPVVKLILEGDDAFADLEGQEVLHLADAPWTVAVLAGGMASGLPSIALRLDFTDEDGRERHLVAETSWAAFAAAARGVGARYGWPGGPPVDLPDG